MLPISTCVQSDGWAVSPLLSHGLWCVMQALNFEEGQPLSEVQIVAQAAEQAMAELDRAITNTMRLLDNTGRVITSIWAAWNGFAHQVLSLALLLCAHHNNSICLCFAQQAFLPHGQFVSGVLAMCR